MPVNAASLSRFYQTPLGRELAGALAEGIARYKMPSQSDSALGFGYTAPFFTRFAENAAQRFAFMPAAIAPSAVEPPAPKQAAKKTGKTAAGAQRLGAERRFPLSDNSIDCILAVHALEFSPDAQAQLAELWRVLAANGRLILAVPNRRGLWARSETMPFGQGQPYSRGQLAEMLSQTGFEFSEIDEIGHFLPHKNHRLTLLSKLYSKIARHCCAYFGAVLLVEAKKRLYKPVLRPNLKPRPVFAPDFTPARAQARLRKLSRKASIPKA